MVLIQQSHYHYNLHDKIHTDIDNGLLRTNWWAGGSKLWNRRKKYLHLRAGIVKFPIQTTTMHHRKATQINNNTCHQFLSISHDAPSSCHMNLISWNAPSIANNCQSSNGSASNEWVGYIIRLIDRFYGVKIHSPLFRTEHEMCDTNYNVSLSFRGGPGASNEITRRRRGASGEIKRNNHRERERERERET